MRVFAALVAASSLLATAAPAAAQTPGSTPGPRPPASVTADPNALRRPASLDARPPLHRLTARQALAVADAQEAVRRERSRHARVTREAFLKGAARWQVSYYDARRREVAQVLIDDASGAVVETWTGFKVAWTMARGYRGAFGRKVNALYVWLPLCVLFLLPFASPRGGLRLLHLDLLVLLAFSVSLAFFNHGEIGWSVPLVYPPLLYLLARMLAIGWRRRAAPREPLRLLVPASWLLVAAVFLVGFRVGLNVTDSNVIDVGYSGVIGADRIADGDRLYGSFPRDNQHGDTYGPVVYAAYLPFEQALPWSGRWDDLPAAHAAAIAFDLLTVLLLWLLGRRLRGPTLGALLAYAWVTFPFTLFVANTNGNDALVAALAVAALLAAGAPVRRGALAALAGLAKFAPLALAPLLARHRDDRPGARSGLLFAAAFAVAAALALVPALLHGGDLGTFYDRTLGFQRDRGSPFSVWGYRGGLGGLQAAVQAGAVALALLAAAVPRRREQRDTVRLAALAAAVLIALQLGVTHWFYLYIAWFFPLVMVALLGRHPEPPARLAAPA